MVAMMTLSSRVGDLMEPSLSSPPGVDVPATVQVLIAAQAWWARHLGSGWAWTYLGQRGLQSGALRANAGWAPAGWTATVDHLRSLGHTDSALLAAGVAMKSATGNVIDRFRDRLMFPIKDATHTIVGFVGRAAPDAADVPKWLNSPASGQYRKTELLFKTEDASPQSIPIVVEGILDAIAINMAGKNIAVTGMAPCGTALTADHARQLCQLAGQRPIAFAFDGDQAGRDATVRAWRTMTNTVEPWHPPPLLHIPLPQGKDPADLIAHGQPEQLRSAMMQAQPLAITAADSVIESAGRLDHIAAQLAVMRHLIKADLPFVHHASRQRYIMHLSRQLDLIDPMDLGREMVEAISPNTPIEAVNARLIIDQEHPHSPTQQKNSIPTTQTQIHNQPQIDHAKGLD